LIIDYHEDIEYAFVENWQNEEVIIRVGLMTNPIWWEMCICLLSLFSWDGC